METNSLELFGFFDVYGRESTHVWNCFFNITDIDITTTFIYNGKSYNNPDDILLKRYTLLPLQGQLSNNQSIIKNAIVDFIKTNNVQGTYGDIVIESAVTDSSGKYIAYIEPGTYDLLIHTGKSKIRQKNVNIQEGIKCDRNIIVTGPIKSKHHDIIEIANSDYNYIFGKIVNKYNKPIKKAQILVIQNNQVIINTFTNADGEYRMSLPYGEYLIKLRCENFPTKTVTITLDNLHGFAEQLVGKSIAFKHDTLILN